eukprot:scaffold3045_cov179-Ochromonas_danica.AAC.13
MIYTPSSQPASQSVTSSIYTISSYPLPSYPLHLHTCHTSSPRYNELGGESCSWLFRSPPIACYPLPEPLLATALPPPPPPPRRLGQKQNHGDSSRHRNLLEAEASCHPKGRRALCALPSALCQHCGRRQRSDAASPAANPPNSLPAHPLSQSVEHSKEENFRNSLTRNEWSEKSEEEDQEDLPGTGPKLPCGVPEEEQRDLFIRACFQYSLYVMETVD